MHTPYLSVSVQKNEASAKYKSDIEKVKKEELQKQQAVAAQVRKEAELKLHKV